MSDLVLLRLSDGGRSAVISMNRPEQRNATSIAMLDRLDAALEEISVAGTVRTVVLSGQGRSFCSGLDLAEVRSDPDTIRRLLVRLRQVMRRIRRLEPVTIAAVHGAAIGGGFGFMCACDLAVTHPEARIGYPPVATGLSPALMAPWLIRKLGSSAARAMMLQAGTISGDEAHRRGLATHLTEAESVVDEAMELAAATREAPDGALAALKALLNDLDGSSGGDEDLDRAALVSAEVMASAATQDALTRLLDGR